jgi:hypothetical protein
MHVHESFVGQVPEELLEIYDTKNKSAFDEAIVPMLESTESPSNLRWGLAQGLWAFKIQPPFDFFESLRLYIIKDVVERILKLGMPVWIANADLEGFFPGPPQKVADALGERATLHNFTGGAAYHCQSGAYTELSRVLFAWLNERLS